MPPCYMPPHRRVGLEGVVADPCHELVEGSRRDRIDALREEGPSRGAEDVEGGVLAIEGEVFCGRRAQRGVAKKKDCARRGAG